VVHLPLLALPFLLVAATSASATTFSFHCIAGDGGGACAIPVEELSLEVSDLGGGEVAFTFHNDDGDPSSIVAIYFDDDADVLASLVSVDDGSGVDFDEGGSPGNLPSGNVESFSANWVFTADNPQKTNGVNPGEDVTITFEASFADVIEALEDGDLQVGLHAPAFGNHGNKSFVNDEQAEVPEPGVLALLALGVVGAFARRR